MSSNLKPPTNLINAKVDGATLRAGQNLTPNTAALVTQTARGGIIRRATLKLSAVVVAVTAALDYGSVKLADLPNGNLLFLGAVANLTQTSTGIDTSAANVDVAVGTAAASNAVLSGTMLNLVPKIDSTAGGVVDGASATANIAVFATSNTDVFLNVAAATTIDGSVIVSGTIDLFYLDLGNPA
jgi:hypothetical protein